MPPDQRRSTEAIEIRFEPFELNVFERSLKKPGETVPLGGRPFDLLLALIERSGEADRLAVAWRILRMETGAHFGSHLILSGSYA
jgi:hypothetical protein